MSNFDKGKYRRGTRYKVSFPTLPSLSYEPRRVELLQKKYNHDILTLEFTHTSPRWFEIVKTGVPVVFSWSRENFSNTFIGYVSFITKNVVGQIEDVMEVQCIGSTFVFKERVTRVFRNQSIPDAVKQIVEEFGFNFVGENHELRFEQLTIAGHSYWEWIQEQAKRIGYGISVLGMNFCFRPLDNLIDQNIDSIPTLTMMGTQLPINSLFLDRTLDSVKVFNGEYIESSEALRATKVVSGVDPITAQIISAKRSPKEVGAKVRTDLSDVLFTEIRSDQVATSETAARSLSEGAAHLGRFNMPARIKCQGDPRIKPFSPVLLQNTGSLSDGYWIVDEVKHMFARVGDYQIDMMVSADGTGLNERTVKRQDTDNIVGMVNLNEALRNNGVNLNSLNSNAFSLSSYGLNVSESNQGYRRTPRFWKYDPKGNGGLL